MTDAWVPGQPTRYYGEGDVIERNGRWYRNDGGVWQLMTQQEIEAHLQHKQETA